MCVFLNLIPLHKECKVGRMEHVCFLNMDHITWFSAVLASIRYTQICVQGYGQTFEIWFASVLFKFTDVLQPPQDIMCPMTTVISTSFAMLPTKEKSEGLAHHSSFVPTAPQRTSCSLLRMNATLTSLSLPPRLASLRYFTSCKFNHLFHCKLGRVQRVHFMNTFVLLFVAQQKVEEAQKEKDKLLKNMALLQQEKERLEVEKESLQKECEQEKEICAQLRRESQVRSVHFCLQIRVPAVWRADFIKIICWLNLLNLTNHCSFYLL